MPEFTSWQAGPQLLSAWLGACKPSSLSWGRTTMSCHLHSMVPPGIKLGVGLKVSLCLVVSPSLSCSPTTPLSTSLINHLHENTHPQVGF